MNTLDILATLIAQIMISNLGLSNYHLAAVVPLVAATLGYLSTNSNLLEWFHTRINNMGLVSNTWVDIMPSTTIFGWGLTICVLIWLIFRWWRNQFVILEINKTPLVSKIITYITLNKGKFNKFPSMINGDANLVVYNSLEITNEFTDNYMKPGQTIYFWNTIFGSGYLTTHLRYINCDKDKNNIIKDNQNDNTNNYSSNSRYSKISIPIYSCILNVLQPSVNPSVLENLDTILYADNNIKSRDAPYLKLINYKIHANKNTEKKIMPISIVEYPFYEGQNCSLTDFEPIYMNTHFHTEKDRLWALIKEIDQNKDYYQKYGQTPKLNLLLHGPPGTGKSSFAYRVAMCLRRDIISMDLTKYPNRYIIDKLMHGYINVCLNLGIVMNPNRLVYVFDEFDRTIEFLIAAQDKEKRIFESKLKAMSAGSSLAALLGTNLGNPGTAKQKNNSGTDNDADENITPELEPVATVSNTSSASQLLTIKDLLEIFQGVVDVNGRLIFAMTNHFDKIKAECPALFRPGRLTPVYFGYIGLDTLREIVEYYFKKTIPQDDQDSLPSEFHSLPSEFQIPTSEIIEQAIYFSSSDKGYTGFMKWLIGRCS